MGSGGSYDWWKSYGNSWNACFYSAVVSALHYFSGIVYLRLKKQNIKQVTKTEIEEYTKEEDEDIEETEKSKL